MRPFRFRAQVALDLRLKQEEQALRVLAKARETAARADARTETAIGAVSQADRVFQDAQREGINGHLIGWHRSWIAKQRLEVEARRREAAISAAIADRAATSVNDAHRQRRTLERLRDRSRRTYDVEAARQDTREMNMLAGLRYYANAGRNGGSHGDNRSDHPVERRKRDD